MINPPWLSLRAKAKEGVKNIAKDGSQSKSNPRLPEKYLILPARVKGEYAPNIIL
jgi:hypothetical protein